MGIQPIDLQTMYSQLSNATKTMTGQQQVQLTQSMQQQNTIQKNIENSQKVQNTSNDNTNAPKTNKDGSNGGTFYGQSKNGQYKNESDDEQNVPPKNNSNPYVGHIIDITR